LQRTQVQLLNLWKVQNIYFSFLKQNIKQIEELAKSKEKDKTLWFESFKILGKYLSIKV
jgi:hypothetical protein